MWQTDGSGSYRGMRYRAVLQSADNGEFRVTTVVPEQYYGAKHIHVIITHPAYRPLTTRILFKGDPHVSADNEDLAILLEEVHADGASVMVGGVEFVLAPL
jgi:protocatechuate 3,4-dioxygenase beta subunit